MRKRDGESGHFHLNNSTFRQYCSWRVLFCFVVDTWLQRLHLNSIALQRTNMEQKYKYRRIGKSMSFRGKPWKKFPEWYWVINGCHSIQLIYFNGQTQGNEEKRRMSLDFAHISSALTGNTSPNRFTTIYRVDTLIWEKFPRDKWLSFDSTHLFQWPDERLASIIMFSRIAYACLTHFSFSCSPSIVNFLKST